MAEGGRGAGVDSWDEGASTCEGVRWLTVGREVGGAGPQEARRRGNGVCGMKGGRQRGREGVCIMHWVRPRGRHGRMADKRRRIEAQRTGTGVAKGGQKMQDERGGETK